MTPSVLSNLFPAWPVSVDPLAMGALALVLAAVCGELVFRFLRLPRITGYSLAGLVAGPSLLGWIGADVGVGGMRLLIDLSLALLLFELGVRVNLRWFRHNPMILASSVAEAALAFVAVFLVVTLLGYQLEIALVVATVSMTTSPAVVMRVAGELRARGQVTDRLLVMTALNVVYAVIVANLVLGYIHRSYGGDWLAALLHPLYQLGGSALVALLLAKVFHVLRRHFDPQQEQASLLLFALLMLTMALLQTLKLPALLAPLLAGILVKHADPRPHLWPRHFGSVGGVLVILLFVMTGAALTWQHLFAGGFVALALIAVRSGGKLLGVLAFGRWSGITLRQSLALGLALSPLSGVAFVLTADIGRLYPALNAELGGIVLSMIAILELLGPVIVQQSLAWAGESRPQGNPEGGEKHDA